MPEIQVSPLVLAPGLAMIAVALIYIFGWKITERPPWSFFLWGMVAVIIAVIIRTILRVTTEGLVIDLATGNLADTISIPLVAAYFALVAGLAEVAGMLLITRFTRVGRASWERAIAFGIGFGALWTLILALFNLWTPLRALLWPQLTDARTLFTLQMVVGNFWSWFGPIMVERIAAIAINAVTAVLLIYGYRKLAWQYLALAILYAILAAGPTAADEVGFIANEAGNWIAKGILGAIAVGGLAAAIFLQSRYEELEEEEEESAVEDIHSDDDSFPKPAF